MMSAAYLVACLAVGAAAGDTGNTGIATPFATVTPYTYEIKVNAGAATRGPTAPAWSDTKAAEYAGLAFDADNETAHLAFHVPSCWDTASDINVEIYWSNESGTALSNTETVKWDISWRSIAFPSEAVDNGTAETDTVTYTQSGAGVDGAAHRNEIVMDHDGGNQTFATGDLVGIEFSRDMTGDTYGSDAVLIAWHIEFTANKVCMD